MVRACLVIRSDGCPLISSPASRCAAYASCLAGLRDARGAAACLITPGAFRLSVLVKLVSDSVLTGFKAGAGLTLATTQLPTLLGVSGGGHNDPACDLALCAAADSAVIDTTRGIPGANFRCSTVPRTCSAIRTTSR